MSNEFQNTIPIHVFSFSEKNEGLCFFGKKVPIGNYWVSTSERTSLHYASANGKEILIVGDCTHLQWSVNGNELASSLVERCLTLEDFLNEEYYLGGKYIIVLKFNAQYYLFGDATCSIPINYYTGQDKRLCSSSIQEIADELNLLPDQEFINIRLDGEIAMAMPYDITIYREIKQLLPNHYLHITQNQAKRCVYAKRRTDDLTSTDAVMLTDKYIRKLTDFYAKNYNLVCPITSGRDSRVVMAYLGNSIGNRMSCFTQWLYGFTKNTQDIYIPQMLTSKKKYAYNILYEKSVPQYIENLLNKHLGEYVDERTIINAYTIKSAYGEDAIVNGDIIGQIGKCSLHRDIPEKWASASYFRCKIHNYSSQTVNLTKNWIKDVVDSGEDMNLFDLFSIENRMGRWAAQENVVYNLVGQAYLNIFNAKCIFVPWTNVDRKKRKLSEIHKEYIRLKDSELLSIPFEKDSLSSKIAKFNSITYYASSFVKYWITKALFRIRHRNV